MKKNALSLLMALLLVCSVSVPALATGDGTADRDQTQDRAQDQTCLQSEDCTEEEEQARLRLRDRLSVSDDAKTQAQARLQEKDETGSCFTDTEGHWAGEELRAAYGWGLVNGRPDGSFHPDEDVSGTQCVLMMARMMNCIAGDDTETETGTEAEAEAVDWDAVPVWAREQMGEAAALHIAAQSQNYGEQPLSRLQFAVMLARTLGLDPTDISADTLVFLDQDEIPESDLGYVQALKTLGIIEGIDGCFCGELTVTRAQAAVMLGRVLETLE
ncbi:MAG TPA: S-layer homology domain-containing protein [Oscillospiraceae bacterium]|nr:S-layer homology domain-containing protein [Oscillospiraceae bacterium]